MTQPRLTVTLLSQSHLGRYIWFYGPRLSTPNPHLSWNSTRQFCLQMEQQRVRLKPSTLQLATGCLNISLKSPWDFFLQWSTPKCLFWNPSHIPFRSFTILRVPPWNTVQYLLIGICPLELNTTLQMPASMLPKSRAAVVLRWPFQHCSQIQLSLSKVACSQERALDRFWIF